MDDDRRQNCWEFMRCGREPGGARVSELGICPATTDRSADGSNAGQNGGRICWAIVGTLCGGKVQGTFAQKRVFCRTCDFYHHVKKTNGASAFMLLKPGQEYKDCQR